MYEHEHRSRKLLNMPTNTEMPKSGGTIATLATKSPMAMSCQQLVRLEGAHKHLIAVDYYCHYPEVAELRDPHAKTVIAKTKSLFSRHGIPEEVVRDNGPQHSGREYKEFAEDYGFVHHGLMSHQGRR